MKTAPPPRPDGWPWSVEQIEFFILPLCLHTLADDLDGMGIKVDTNAIRAGADEIERLRRQYEPEWTTPEDTHGRQ